MQKQSVGTSAYDKGLVADQIDKKIDISVQYCKSWGFKSQYNFAREKLLLKFPNAQFSAIEDEVKTRNFIIRVGDDVVHDKVATNAANISEENIDQLIEKISKVVV